MLKEENAQVAELNRKLIDQIDEMQLLNQTGERRNVATKVRKKNRLVPIEEVENAQDQAKRMLGRARLAHTNETETLYEMISQTSKDALA